MDRVYSNRQWPLGYRTYSTSQQHPSSAADDTPTDLDFLLDRLNTVLKVIMDILGPYLGFPREQTEAIEADIDTLMADIKAIVNGDIDLDKGLEALLQDIVDLLHDFGLKSQLESAVRTARKWKDKNELQLIVGFELLCHEACFLD